MGEKQKILETRALIIGYEKKGRADIIASAIEIELHQGELVAVIGANGVGKSTLLRTLSNVQKPISGSILIKDKIITSYLPNELAMQLSLVLTDTMTANNLTVSEMVALGRQPYTNWMGQLDKEDRVFVRNALEQMHIAELSMEKCHELSDGQLQKALIARAIAQDTSLILLDEPTSHLDMYHKTYVLQLMRKLTVDTKKTLLFSTHEINLAIQLCDKMVLLTPDEVHLGTPQELIKKGCFSKLFPDDLIHFDTDLGQLKVKSV